MSEITVFEWIVGFIIIFAALGLVGTVLFQSGKEKGLSGSIVGGADAFGGKSKKAKRDAQLNTITTVLTVVFAVLAVALYIYVATHTHTH